MCIFTIIFFLTLWGNWNYIGVGQSNFCLVWVFLRTCLVYPQPLLSVRFLLVVYSFPSVSSFHQIIFEKKAYKFVNLISIFSNAGKNIFAKYWAVSKKQHKWVKVSLDIVSSSFICYISQLNLEKKKFKRLINTTDTGVKNCCESEKPQIQYGAHCCLFQAIFAVGRANCQLDKNLKILCFLLHLYQSELFLMKNSLWLFNIGGKVPQILLKKVSYLANSRDLYFTWYSCTFISCIVGELSWKLQHCWIKGQPCIYFSRVIPMVSPPSLDAHLAFLNFLSFYSNEFDPWFRINVYLILSVTKGSFQI